MIWLDMDGTIANLYKDGWLEEVRNKNTKPYEVADKLVDEEVLLNLIKKGYKLGVISWCAKGEDTKYDEEVKEAKKKWLKANYPNVKFDKIRIVKYGYPKQNFYNDGDILVDDEEPNRNNWLGKAIKPEEIYCI